MNPQIDQRINLRDRRKNADQVTNELSNQVTDEATIKATDQTANQSADETTDQSTYSSPVIFTNQSLDLATHCWTDQSTNVPITHCCYRLIEIGCSPGAHFSTSRASRLVITSNRLENARAFFLVSCEREKCWLNGSILRDTRYSCLESILLLSQIYFGTAGEIFQ
jgi:hypothetical protein